MNLPPDVPCGCGTGHRVAPADACLHAGMSFRPECCPRCRLVDAVRRAAEATTPADAVILHSLNGYIARSVTDADVDEVVL